MCVHRLSPNVRILSSLFIILLVFVVTTVLVKVDVSDCRTEFFIGTLASVAVVSGASNLFSGSVFGTSGHFPMRISQALISGTVKHIKYIFCYSVHYLAAYKGLMLHSVWDLPCLWACSGEINRTDRKHNRNGELA